MKTTLQFLGFSIHSSAQRVLDEHLDLWQRLTAVTSTEVVLERQLEPRQTFRVLVHLEVTDEVLHAEAAAASLKGALLAASQDLENQIQTRNARRVERKAVNPCSGPASARALIFGPFLPEAGAPAAGPADFSG